MPLHSESDGLVDIRARIESAQRLSAFDCCVWSLFSSGVSAFDCCVWSLFSSGVPLLARTPHCGTLSVSVNVGVVVGLGVGVCLCWCVHVYV